MEESPSLHPGLEQDQYQYHTLGRKTLTIFVLQRISAALLFLLLSAVLFTVGTQASLVKTSVGNIAQYSTEGGWISLAIFAIFFAIGFLVAWLTYTNYKFALGDDSLKIKRGIINKEEVAIPYRQIQDVDINRDLAYQMMGLSKIIILTAGHEDAATIKEDGGEDESEGILPALDKNLAEWLQSELLKRANVQKVEEEK